jgi:hypothetical protein
MKRNVMVLAVVLLGFAAVRGTVLAQAPTQPTVDQILEKHITAIGGRAAMEKVTSRVSKGTVEIADAGMSGTITVSEKAPNKSLAMFDIGGMGSVREGTDGTVAWSDNPQTGLVEKTGAELADALRGAIFNSELKLKTMYKTVETAGKEMINGHEAYAIVATPAEGATVKMFFDVVSGLMVKQSSTRESPQGPLDVDVLMDDYRAVDGVKQPFTIRQVTSMFTIVVKMNEIKLNVPLDDAMFKKPGL